MTYRQTLLALADRVERAEGPDYQLDREIHVAIGLELPKTIESRTVDGVPTTLVVKGEYVRRVTGSLDAAMKLLPHGALVTMERTWSYGLQKLSWSVRIFPRGPGFDFFRSEEATDAPLAVTAAALRASAAMMEGE